MEKSFSLSLSAGILGLTFFLALPLNGAMVLIFLRRKKLRHLVNFLLVLDAFSHLLVTLFAIPIFVFVILTGEGVAPYSIILLGDFVGDFANVHGTILTLSIAVLRYRRLCWKKKDALCLLTGLTWSLANGTAALALTLLTTAGKKRLLKTDADDIAPHVLTFTNIKVALSVFAVFIVLICYLGVCRRVWGNPTNEKKRQQRVSRLRLRATFHSAFQVLLLTVTMVPHLYAKHLQLDGNEKGSNNEDRLSLLMATTANYALLVSGSPLAYVASCGRFREEFISLFFSKFPRHLFQKISSTNQSFHPKLHLLSTTSNMGMRHKVLFRIPTTQNTSSTTSSTRTSDPLSKTPPTFQKLETTSTTATVTDERPYIEPFKTKQCIISLLYESKHEIFL